MGKDLKVIAEKLILVANELAAADDYIAPGDPNAEEKYKIIRQEEILPFVVEGYQDHEKEIQSLKQTVEEQGKKIDELIKLVSKLT